jgi:hypothetical protein
MKTEAKPSEKKTIGKRELASSHRTKNRDVYVGERERIKQEIGGLEEIRGKLGLSQRRVCQLLLVDPSAWTRWNKSEAPPHIYQALRWLLELKKVNPEAAGPIDLTKRVDFIQANTQTKIRELEQNLAMVERAVALVPRDSAGVSQFGDFDEALRNQENRFQARISELEKQIEELKAKRLRQRAKKSHPKKLTAPGGRKKNRSVKKHKKPSPKVKRARVNKKRRRSK